MKIKNVLVVGGAGYIGSHMTQLLLDKGYTVTVFDNFSQPSKVRFSKARYIKGDLRNYADILKALKTKSFDLVMYFAGLIIAPESNVKPVKYYDNNVLAAVNLSKAMEITGVKNIVFSSTAAVYGNPKSLPIKETSALTPINSYGNTKLIFEMMLQDLARADKNFKYIALRYFNAAGAHTNGKIGECHEPETHLIPNVLRTLKGELKEIQLFGDDYPTKDGTCIRDYIHVEDLCEAHYLAIKALDRGIKNEVFNLGTGKGYSVKEIITTVHKVTGQMPKIKISPRRPGDPAKLIASSAKAHKILGWKPSRDLTQIIQSAWQWEKNYKR